MSAAGGGPVAPRGGRAQRWGGVVLAAALAVFARAPAYAYEFLIAQTSHAAAYEEAAEAFRRAVGDISALGPKRVWPHGVATVVLSDPDGSAELTRRLRSTAPDLVVALGTAALDAVRPSSVPIVYALVPRAFANGARPKVSGVPLEVPAEAALDALLRLAPEVRRIGTVYDPARSTRFVSEAQTAAARRGLALEALPVNAASEIPKRLRELRGRVDALWMLPDLTLSAPAAVDALMLAAVEMRVPVLTFSERYLERGATLSVAVDPAAAGARAAELALGVLGSVPGAAPAPPAQGVRVRVNRTAAEKLGLPGRGGGAP